MNRTLCCCALLAVAAVLTASPHASAQLFVVDFEDLPEQTAISDQFDHLGVTFAIDGSKDALPIIAVEGSPTVAFQGAGADAPMASLSGGLTDPVVGSDPFSGQDIVMHFDPAVTTVRFFIIDIDSGEVFNVRAFDGETEIAVITKTSGDSGTGNGVSTEFSFEADSITRVLVDGPDPSGFALDFLTFTRPCEGPGCGVQIQVAQESAPGAGDFNDHVLGVVRPFPFSGSAAEFYAYDVPEGDSWNGPALSPVADRSHLLLASTTDGLSLFVVHDRAVPDDPDGGSAEMMFELFDDDGAARTVLDDPPGVSGDVYTGEPGELLFTTDHAWDPCCTDGVALSGLDCRSTTIMQFTDTDENPSTPAIGGMSEWFAISATGEEVELVLEEGRRVRLIVFPDPECPADLNCTDSVDFADLLILLSAWGPCPSCPEDIDGSGSVDFVDLLTLLNDWGPCAG